MLSAAENLTLPLTIAGRAADRGFLAALVDRVGLGDRLDHRPAELSGGQQQRVAVARALVSKPAVLFADEPTGNLDSRTGREVLDLLRRSVDEFGQTIVMVTHDPGAATIADRVLFLKDGGIVLDRDRMSRDEIFDTIKELEGADGPRRRGTQRRRPAATALGADAATPRRCAMTRLALRSLLSRRLRTALTIVAILLGVAMISGTYVLTDQIHNAFNDIFKTAYQNTSVVVTPEAAVRPGGDASGAQITMPASTLARVRQVPGVQLADGSAQAFTAVFVRRQADQEQRRADLHPVQRQTRASRPARGSPAAFRAGTRRGRRHQRLRRQASSRPRRHASASPPTAASRRVRIAGIYRWPAEASLGGTIMVDAPLADVQRWFGLDGRLSSIDVAAAPGVSADRAARQASGPRCRRRST